MRTRAVALASERSRAVGQVELECLPEALVILYRGVGAFQEGYAPGALTTGTRIEVPWSAVREASFEADRLFLQVDETLTPHHRLLLSGFSTGDPPDPTELRKQRLLLRLGTGVAMLVGGLLAAVTVARLSSDAGASAAVLLGCFGAGVVLFVGMVADHRLGLGGPATETARVGLAMDLIARLPHLSSALDPSRPRTVADAKAEPQGPPLGLPSFQSLLPRTTAAVVITMSAAILGAVLTAGWLARTPMRPISDDRERSATPERAPAAVAAPAPIATMTAAAPSIAPPAASAPNLPTSGAVALGAPCTCQRSDSLLWRDGLPRLSTVLIDRRQKEHNGHQHLELDLGVVNNWEKPF
ncbi:MAG TPA: hypothetical protein VF400_12165, partial [Anaeromyxobacteraceae bacterium]